MQGQLLKVDLLRTQHPAEAGADRQAVLMSNFRTLKQRGHNPVSAVLEAVRTYLRTGLLPPLPAKSTEIG